jgi:hypothetical protein
MGCLWFLLVFLGSFGIKSTDPWLKVAAVPTLVLMAVIWVVIWARFCKKYERAPGTSGAEGEEAGGPPAPITGLTARDERLRQLLDAAEGDFMLGLSVLPSIDSTLLATVRKRCDVPSEERVLAMLDFSGLDFPGVLREATGLVFCCAGLYWQNGDRTPHPGTGSLRYAELAGRHMVNHGNMVWLGDDLFLCPNPSDSGIDCERLLWVLNKLRQTMEERPERRRVPNGFVKPRRGVFGAERGSQGARAPSLKRGSPRAPLRRLRVAAKRMHVFSVGPAARTLILCASTAPPALLSPEVLMQRRQFLHSSFAAMLATGSVPAVITARDKSGTKNAIIGSGEHRYECIHNWGELPKHIHWQTTHGVTVDAEGLVYITQ